MTVHLGGLVQDYQIALPARIGAGMLSIGGAAFAFLMALLLVFGLQHTPNDGGMTVLFNLIFALPLVLLGLFLLWRFIQLCALRATIHADGLTIRTLSRQASVTWGDVSSLTSDAPRPPHPVVLLIMVLFCWFLVIPYVLSRLRPRLKYSLTLTTGERIRIPSALAGKTSLIDTIDTTVASQQFSATVARFRNGIPSHFGAFSADADGVHARKKVLPWRDVHIVTRTASGIAVFRTGEQSAWASAPLKAVPNPALFQALVTTVCEETRGYRSGVGPLAPLERC